MQGASHSVIQPDTESKGEKRYIEIEKDKSPEAKDRWDKLRKTG